MDAEPGPAAYDFFLKLRTVTDFLAMEEGADTRTVVCGVLGLFLWALAQAELDLDAPQRRALWAWAVESVATAPTAPEGDFHVQ